MSLRVGEVWDNPATGERGVVRVVPDESNGYRLAADVYVRPGGAVAGEHVHPQFTEIYTMVRGQLGVRRDGREVRLEPGMRADVARGTAHYFWNDGPDEARFVVEVQPAGRFAPMIRNLFMLAQDGKTDAGAGPDCSRAWRATKCAIPLNPDAGPASVQPGMNGAPHW